MNAFRNPGGGGVVPYLGYMGTCRWTRYGFWPRCPKQVQNLSLTGCGITSRETLTQTASSLFLFLACELGPARS